MKYSEPEYLTGWRTQVWQPRGISKLIERAFRVQIDYWDDSRSIEGSNGVFFTALNFALGVSTWSFSPLKFQADMGTLMTFMFMTNMVMALTALPGLAVVIDTVLPRKKLPYPGPETGGHWH